MPKNIVICSDGTGNSDVKGRGTNVFKLFEAVDNNGHLEDSNLVEQITFYDDGVGTENFKPVRLAAGAVGIGLARNVRQLYTSLVRVYQPGDRLYLFGFSRGAFTVRTLAAMIARCGILKNKFGSDAELRKAVSHAYGTFRKDFRKDGWEQIGARVRNLLYTSRAQPVARAADETSPKIAFIGVWDTVDAVGLPSQSLSQVLNKVFRFKFPDRKLSPIVEKACHALAIDEQRQAFQPVLWDETDEQDGRI